MSTPANLQPPSTPRTIAAARGGTRSKKTGGGTAAGGGINFQAAVTAIAGAHLLRGTAIGWLPVPDVPVAVWAESEGAGDDVRLELASGLAAEVQAKKGLNRGKRLWEALEALMQAVQAGSLDYGMLAVAPDSSSTVREDLADDLGRLAQGRADHLTDIGKELHNRLQALGGPCKEACGRIVIRVVHALEADGADIRAAKEALRRVCADDDDADAAWNALYQDAVLRIEHRGRWTIPILLAVLRKAGVAVRNADFPAAISQKLADWVVRTHRGFTLPAIRKSLPLDALINMRTVGTSIEQPEAEDAASALARYHNPVGSLENGVKIFDAEWTGQFRPHSVVVAGPGLGKSTLMKVLAERYASDGLPVLAVRLKQVAPAVERGAGFEEALHIQALDGSGISPDQLRRANLKNLVVLADGLDDCGSAHDTVARALHAFAVGHPSARIVVTTRPIGYTTAAFAEWQHYRLLAPAKDNGAANLAKLLGALQNDEAGEASSLDDTRARATRELARSRAAETICSSPLLLGMAAAVIAARNRLPDTRPQLYAELIGLFETGRDNASQRPVPASIATRILNGMGWLLMRDPLISAEQVMENLSNKLAEPLGRTPLGALEVVEPVLSYWEQLGIVERLHHGGVAYWTFIHRSFTEFTAARHLLTLPAAERRDELDRLVDLSDWHEVVTFAAGLGLGDEIARLFVGRRAAGDEGQMERALRLAGDRDANVSVGQVQDLAEMAFEAVAAGGSDRFSIGVALADLAGAHPAMIAPIASARRDHTQTEVQLVAWACLVAAAPKERSAAELEAALARLLPKVTSTVRTSLLGGLQIGHKRDRDLIERIALAALDAQPDSELERFAETQLAHETLGTWGFREKVQALFRLRLGKPPPALPWEKSASQLALASLNPSDGWRTKSRRAIRALAKAAMAGGDGGETADRLPQFGALYALTGFGEVPAYDVNTWSEPYDETAVAIVVQAVVHASAIDPQALSIEAATMIRRLEADDESSPLLDLPQVDVPEPNWSKAAAAVADRTRLVAAMNHGSDWLAYLAAKMLAASPATSEESRALLDVRGSSLWAATAVVREQQPVDTANALIIDRLAGPLPDGSQHLFKGLEGRVPSSPAVWEAIRSGLASPHGRVAAAAASLARDLAQREQPITTAILLMAYDRWRQAEPDSASGFIPSSPREILLELLVERDAFGQERMLAALSDPRSDVRNAAEKHLLGAMAASPPLGDAVVARIMAHELPAGLAANVLRGEPSLSSEQVAELENLLSEADPKWRRVGVELLRPSYLSSERIAQHAARLLGDDEAEIREAVAARCAATEVPASSPPPR